MSSTVASEMRCQTCGGDWDGVKYGSRCQACGAVAIVVRSYTADMIKNPRGYRGVGQGRVIIWCPVPATRIMEEAIEDGGI